MKNKYFKAGILLFLIAAIIGGFLIVKSFYTQEAVSNQEKADLPSPIAAVPKVEASKQAESTPIPEEINWEVPFTSQAPKANWDAVHEEACEEAAILMAQKYFDKQQFSSTIDADEQILKIIDWENTNLGFFQSTTVEQTAEVTRRYLGLQAEVINTPSVDEIKTIIASGKLVIVPAAGQELSNPFYKAPGPIYHMLLIKGYTVDQFITNDPGTRRGANYPYKFDTIINANHDWNGGDVVNGARKIIVVWK